MFFDNLSIYSFEFSRAARDKRTAVNATGYGLDMVQENKNLRFTRSGNEVKRDVKFRYSRCNASRIRWKLEPECFKAGFHVPSTLLRANTGDAKKNFEANAINMFM